MADVRERPMPISETCVNWPTPDHFRVVFLPNTYDLREAMGRIATFLAHYRSRRAQPSPRALVAVK